MTYSLGSVTFTDGEAVRVISTLTGGITHYAMPGNDSSYAQSYSFEGMSREVRVFGQIWGATSSELSARASQLEALVTPQQSSIKLVWPLKPNGIYVKIIDLSFDSRSEKGPTGLFAEFQISCMEAARE